ncbi:MAG: hypothetical protein Q9162_004556 [Coniocarpon cinnabarinum]
MPPESDLRDRLSEAYKQLGEGFEQIDDPRYSPDPLHIEWTGRRAGVTDLKAPEPELTDSEKYARLLKDTGDGPTVLYVQGGGFLLGSTVSARTAVKRLSGLANARFITVNHRLAPQWTIPHMLLDIITVYFALLAPPPGSLHAPVSPDRIVIAGESAGAILCVALMQFLLHLQRNSIKSITIHGRAVPVSLPSGLAILSISAELVLSLPSGTTHTRDWLAAAIEPWYLPSWPNEPYWPSVPPRGPLWGDWSATGHPLHSVVFCRDWKGCPPVWITVGLEEKSSDSARLLAKNLSEQGVTVRWEEYEGMTHAFATVMPVLPQSKRCMRAWAEAILDLAKGKGLKGGGVHVRLGKLEEKDMSAEDIRKLISLTLDEAQDLARRTREAKTRDRGVYRGQTEKQETAKI